MAVFWVIAALKAILNTTDIARVHELRDAVVPEAWRVAWIFLNHSPCLSVSLPFVPFSGYGPFN